MNSRFMDRAIALAKEAGQMGEIPVGAVIVKDGEIISRAHNEREKTNRATAHAEVLAIDRASKVLNNWNLSGCELYVTLEPCVMCSGAIISSRISKVIFGAYDKRFGCCGTLYNLLNDRFNHRAPTHGGVLINECEALLKSFFGEIRKNKDKTSADK